MKLLADFAISTYAADGCKSACKICEAADERERYVPVSEAEPAQAAVTVAQRAYPPLDLMPATVAASGLTAGRRSW